MDIQQWIGLIGVALYWLFRAYTGAKKNTTKTSKPQSQYQKRPKPIPASIPEIGFPTPELPRERTTSSQNINEWTEFEETIPFNYDSDDTPMVRRLEPNTSEKPVNTPTNWIKNRAFRGRDAIIYQAILNRPNH